MREIVNVTNNLRDCELVLIEITAGSRQGKIELHDNREHDSFNTIGFFDSAEEARGFAANKGGVVKDPPASALP